MTLNSPETTHSTSGVDEEASLPSVFSPILSGSQPDWLVLHVRSRQEKVVRDALLARGVACWLPLVNTARYYGKQKAIRELPLFPGYLFMRGQRSETYDVDRNGRLVQVLDVPDPDRLVEELWSLDLAIRAGADLTPADYLAKGDRVRVRSGPFKDVTGVVEKRGRPGRLMLQVEMLSRAVSIEIDVGLLDRAD